MSAPTWTPAQQSAIDTRGCTLLVSAAAGSGKTATLTRRIIERITDPEHPADLDRMLIVTFTRAAAAELRERISDALTKAIAADPGNRHLQNQLISLGGAHISTIDAFYLEPVRTHFAESGLPASFRIADDAEILPISERVIGDLIDEFYLKYASAANGGDAFAILDNNPFADLCDSLTPSKEDSALGTVFVALHRNLLSYPEGLSRLGIEADRLESQVNEGFLSSDHGMVVVTHLRELCESALRFYRDTLELLADDEKALAGFGNAMRDDLSFFESLLQALDRGEGYAQIQELLRVYTPTSLTGFKGSTAEPYVSLKNRREKYKEAIASVRDTYFHFSEDEVARQMRETATMCRVLEDFLTAYDRRMTEEKRARGICTFTDNRRYLLDMLLDENGEPSALAKEYRQRFDEVYIDEYQDVDEVQDKIFSLIGGDHRFMVGDIKQSIYVFRGAEPSVFARYRQELPALTEHPVPESPGRSIFMSENFRCDESVIEVSNAVCGHLFRACPESIGYRDEDALRFKKKLPYEGYTPPAAEIAVISADSRKRAADEGREFIPEAEAEAIWIANRIAAMLRDGTTLANGEPVRPKDIAILMRSRTVLNTFVSALQRMGIPTGCEELEAAQASQDILHGEDMMYLVNLLRVMDNPDSDIPLSEVLRAPFPSLTLEEVVVLREDRERRRTESLYAALEAYCDRRDGDVDLTLQSKAVAFRAWLESYRALMSSVPADGILRRLRRDDRCASRDSRAFTYLYESARTCRTSSFTGLYTFLKFFEKKLLTEKKAPADEGNDIPGGTVSLMTIHNSKGLEFPVCFIARCGGTFTSDNDDLCFNKDTGIAMKLYRRTERGRIDTALRAATQLAIHRSGREEEMRVLYVAMTRARERLIMVGKGTKSYLLFPEGDRFSTLSSVSQLAWIMAGLANKPHLAPYYELIPVDGGALTPDEPLPRVTGISSAAESAEARRYRAILDARIPPAETDLLLASVPTKAPASRLSELMLDKCIFYRGDGETFDSTDASDLDKLSTDERTAPAYGAQEIEQIKRTVALMTSSAHNELELLLGAGRRPTAAEKGTAAHLFLQFCSYERVRERGIDEEIARLLEEGYINARTAEVLDRNQLESFFESELFARLLTAERVERELKFHRFVPLAELTANPLLKEALGDRTLFVQGSIDLLAIYPDGSIELCDYKTDRITAEERNNPDLYCARLRETHTAQLEQYKIAVRELYGKEPDRISIFSLPLGESVQI